jgi:hypothetical protein
MKTLATIALTLTMIMAASAQIQTTFRDGRGSTIGTATRDSNGTTTFRDGRGQTTDTATRENNGTVTFRNNLGQQTGTATAPRP